MPNHDIHGSFRKHRNFFLSIQYLPEVYPMTFHSPILRDSLSKFMPI